MLRLIFPQAANKTALTALGCYDVNKPHVPTQVALPMICLDDSTGARCVCAAWSGCLGWQVLVLGQLQGRVLCWPLGSAAVRAHGHAGPTPVHIKLTSLALPPSLSACRGV